MGRPVYISHPSSLRHDTGAHPERADRITAIELELAAREWVGYRRCASPEASRRQLEAVHTVAHVDGIDDLCRRGGGAVDLDTVLSPHSAWAARHAAGGAVELVDLLLAGDAPTGISVHRPPGHHAEGNRAMGFCLFNSIAVGARHAIDSGGASRVAILDWDVHHGNGTNDIFHRSRDVLYASIHESPLYPGTGSAADRGSGEGIGHTINLPVPAGSGDAVFCSLVAHVVVPVLLEFAPDLVLVSAGFDAHVGDPLAACTVTEAGFARMAALLRHATVRLGTPLGAVLEGGYDLVSLAGAVAATMEALTGPAVAPEEVAVHPHAEAAARGLSEAWSGLG
ncbi:MAG TPA: histone deacetylase [Solirubrobacteraceae bacterium]|nr:histone deacetylase [Solirubrobacteraceae bacterium]